MKGGTRPGAGRKPRPDDKMIRVAISLTPEQYDWLSERPEGMAVTVRRLIEDERASGWRCMSCNKPVKPFRHGVNMVGFRCANCGFYAVTTVTEVAS